MSHTPPPTARTVDLPPRGIPRRRLFAVTAAALLGGTAACGRDSGRTTDERIELSVFWWGGDRRAELTEQALKLYTQRHPNVTFRFTWQGDIGYYERLATEAVNGNAPDLFQIDDNYLTEYVERQITLDLTDYVTSGQLDLSGLPSSLVQYGQVGGRLMAVAAAENTPGLIYNKSLLERLDVAEPHIGMSYDEFIDWAVTVTRRSGGKVAGTMDPSADYRAFWLWLRARGKELYHGRQVGFDITDLIAWFRLWEEARKRRATPAVAHIRRANNGDVAQQLVVTGHAATSFMWSNQLPELQKYTEDRLAVITYPGTPQAQWARASMYWSAFRGTRHPATVVDVINFLTNDVAAGRILGTERGVSANLEVRRAVQESLTDETMRATAAFETEMAQRFGSAPVPPPKGHARVRALLIQAAESVQTRRVRLEDAALTFINQANAALTS